MITIKCTASEKRKLCSHDYHIICAMMNALGHCEADCGKCKRRRKDYISWEIISKPKKKKSDCDETKCSPEIKEIVNELHKEFGLKDKNNSSCNNCWANECGMCIENGSPFYKMPIEKIMKIQPHCNVYGAYEGDG